LSAVNPHQKRKEFTVLRETIDLYSSYIDRPKVRLVLYLWLVTFLTVMAGVALTAGGYEPWEPPTFMMVWLALFLTLEGLAALGATFFTFWIFGREQQQPALQAAGEQGEPALRTTFPQAEESRPRVSNSYWEDLDGFWDVPPGSEEAPHE